MAGKIWVVILSNATVKEVEAENRVLANLAAEKLYGYANICVVMEKKDCVMKDYTTVAMGLWLDLMLRRGWAIGYWGEWLLEYWVETAWIDSVS